MNNIVEFPGLGLSFEFNNYIMIGSFKIAYYGMIIGFGMFLAILYAFANFKKVGVDKDKAIDAIIGGIIGGVIGARAYYVIFSWDTFKDDLWSIFNTRTGGLAIYGGIIGALAVGLYVAKRKKIKLAPLLDIIGIGFLLGQGIGRWGNFFNVEAFGSNTSAPWGMTSPSIVSYLTSRMDYFSSVGISVDPTMPVHPCFLYESIWCIIGFIALHFYLKHRRFDGEVFIMYIGYYGLGRFFIEGLRTDSLMIGSLRVSQLLAGLLFIASIIAIVIIRCKIRSKNNGEYTSLFVHTPEGMEIANNDNKDKITEIKSDNTENNNVDNNNTENLNIENDNNIDTEGESHNG